MATRLTAELMKPVPPRNSTYMEPVLALTATGCQLKFPQRKRRVQALSRALLSRHPQSNCYFKVNGPVIRSVNVPVLSNELRKYVPAAADLNVTCTYAVCPASAASVKLNTSIPPTGL